MNQPKTSMSLQSIFTSSRNIYTLFTYLLNHSVLNVIQLKEITYYQSLFLNYLGDNHKIQFNQSLLNELNKEFLLFLESNYKIQKPLLIDNSSQTDVLNTKKNKVKHFQIIFSKDLKNQTSNSILEYDLFLKNVSLIKCNSFKFKFNLHNISNSNNTFALSENNFKYQIKIPIGYYTYDQLLLQFSEKLNSVSKHNYNYSFQNNSIKNKTNIICKDTNGNSQMFNLYFFNNLNNMIGFYNNEYINNHSYITELDPCINIFDTIYIVIYINNEPLNLYKTSSNQYFTFYININENDYNKLLHFSFTKIIYELKSLNIIKFGIQFFDSFFNTINFNQYHFYLDLEFELSEH